MDNTAAGWDLKFYTSSDGVAWTQLGSTITTATITSIADGTQILAVGSTGAGITRINGGKIHYAEIRSGIGGTVVGVFNPNILHNPTDQTPTTLKSPTGETYTISGGGWRWRELAV